MTALDEALWPRAALPRRPMLGAVLDALTAWESDWTPPSVWLARGRFVGADDVRCLMQSPAGGFGWRFDWITTDVAEAYELLQARGLIPMSYVGRFVCDGCGGTGERHNFGETFRCLTCDGAGHRPHPPTVAALASWASLGVAAGDDGAPGILGAEELAREIDDSRNVWWGVSDRPPTPLRGADPGAAISRLTDAGIRWEWQGGAVDRVTLYVPPLGLVS